jgi:hypothetical protein
MVRHLNGDRAWLALAVLVLIYEISCREGELLSQAVDRYLERHPWLTRFVVIQTALHLLNVYDAAPPYVRHLDAFQVIHLLRRAVTR